MRRLIIILALTMAACGGDTSTGTPDGGSGDAGTKQCGTGSAHEQLLNATTPAQAIKKTPRHPAVGAEGLP